MEGWGIAFSGGLGRLFNAGLRILAGLKLFSLFEQVQLVACSAERLAENVKKEDCTQPTNHCV